MSRPASCARRRRAPGSTCTYACSRAPTRSTC
jgi:hypothetical protein